MNVQEIATAGEKFDAKKIFGQCRNGNPSIKARKEWSKFVQEHKKKEKRLAEQIYQELIKKIRIEPEQQGQEGQVQEGQAQASTV